jgi:hypothetical protein
MLSFLWFCWRVEVYLEALAQLCPCGKIGGRKPFLLAIDCHLLPLLPATYFFNISDFEPQPRKKCVLA